MKLLYAIVLSAVSAEYDHLIGKKLAQTVNAPKEHIQKNMFPEDTRFLYHDSITSREYNSARLNVQLDVDGVIASIHYG
jgi:hypothetical protein